MATLAQTSLTDVERRVVERFIRLLSGELGDELLAVWLYGSRARGERPQEDSDVDLLVIAEREPDSDRLLELLHEAADAEGGSSFDFSVLTGTPEWVTDRRSIDAFFIREVDRDKIVLAGLEGEEFGPRRPFIEHARDGVSPRSREYLDAAHEWLAMARAGLEADVPVGVAANAYFAMLNAARAVLSEEDRFTRTHTGTWHILREVAAATGRIDPELVARAEQAQDVRESVHYRAGRVSKEKAITILRDAEELLTVAEDLLGRE
jgi:uncharacterized protein (UPF0332 family)/predicted nucleotidyltransferase